MFKFLNDFHFYTALTLSGEINRCRNTRFETTVEKKIRKTHVECFYFNQKFCKKKKIILIANENNCLSFAMDFSEQCNVIFLTYPFVRKIHGK